MKLFLTFLFLFALSTNLYAQSHPYKGLWALIWEDEDIIDMEKNIKKRCKEFSEGIFNNLMVISDDQIDQVNFNKMYIAKISKMQRLRNTSVDIVDLSWESGTNSRELWVLESGKKSLTVIGKNEDEGWHVSYKKCE